MTKGEAIKNILEYFKENEDAFNECIEELDSYNGYLNDGRYYEMWELNELYRGCDPEELLRRAFYGYDEETWTEDSHGQRVYGAFNPNRYYFTFNGYGNFVSADYKDYSALLDEYFVSDLAENWGHLWNDNDELEALMQEYEDAED